MTNPYFEGPHLTNDNRMAAMTMFGAALASVIGFGLFLAAILSTRACSV